MGNLEEVVRNGLRLDEFRLEPDLAGERIRISAGKYLLPRVYLSYGQSAAPDATGRLALEYKLGNDWVMSAGIREDGEKEIGIEAKFRF